jgi:micrococcal nuclease
MGDWMNRCFAIALFILPLTCGALAEPISVTEISVVDGDTVAAHGQRYRMIGYDTPEVVTPRRRVGPDERAVATIAKERFVELLGSGSKALCHTPLRIKRSSPTELH